MKTSDLMIKHIENSKVEGTTFIYIYLNKTWIGFQPVQLKSNPPIEVEISTSCTEQYSTI